MLNKKLITSILSLSLLVAILSGCGAGGVDVQTSETGGHARLLSISITPSDSQIAQNTVQQFTATGIYSDNTTKVLTESVTWSSSDASVSALGESAEIAAMATQSTMAAPSSSGGHAYAYGKKSGTTTITATSGSISGSTTLTVTSGTTTGSATLAWDAPTTHEDGTPATDLSGFKIYYGTSSGNYTSTIDVGNINTYVVDNLVSGTYYFAVTAYYTSGNQSGYSNEASKTIQ
jgi:hypothetical protein